MTRIAILGDTHWGTRNDLSIFYEHFDQFFSKFVDELVQNNIQVVFQLGDLFDRRKYINFRTLESSKRTFFDRLNRAGITLHTLVGNHDLFFRESVNINSSSLVLGEYDNVVVYQEPVTIKIGNTKIDIIPWICRDNEKQITEFIKKSDSDLCFGHFEIAGFSMYKGMESHDGLSLNMFEKYELVCSGHYHTRSRQHNIQYVGTPYEMTWQDYNDPKGYHIFDTETRELEFIENTNRIFHRIEYTGEDMDGELNVKGCFVKVVVVNKPNIYKFEQFMNNLYNMGCYEIKVVEDLSEFSEGSIDDDINLEDTLDVLSNYIDSIDTEADKENIKTFMKTLYIEAVNSGVVE